MASGRGSPAPGGRSRPLLAAPPGAGPASRSPEPVAVLRSAPRDVCGWEGAGARSAAVLRFPAGIARARLCVDGGRG